MLGALAACSGPPPESEETEEGDDIRQISQASITPRAEIIVGDSANIYKLTRTSELAWHRDLRRDGGLPSSWHANSGNIIRQDLESVRTLVTGAQGQLYAIDNAGNLKWYRHCPVGNIALAEAMAAANKLSENAGLPSCYALSGCSGAVGDGLACTSLGLTTATTYECLGFRLPTEAEREYAARAASKTAFYAGEIRPVEGCAPDPVMERIGWYCLNSGNYSRPVALKEPNAWGLFDMAGNAAEWTTSDYTGTGLGSGPLVDPMPLLGSMCVQFRGGPATATAKGGRSANRSHCAPGAARDALCGFRLVRTLP